MSNAPSYLECERKFVVGKAEGSSYGNSSQWRLIRGRKKFERVVIGLGQGYRSTNEYLTMYKAK